jgi:hypothetical protein
MLIAGYAELLKNISEWMTMFNFFKPRQDHVEELMDNIKDAGYVEPVEAPQDKIVYSVGRTEQGKITLTMGMNGYNTTLTMSNNGVAQLIRMLESAMEQEETE